MNTTVFLLLLLIVLVSLALLLIWRFFLLYKAQNKIIEEKESSENQSITLLNQNVQGMHARLDSVASDLNNRLENATHMMGSVNRELATMQEIGRNMHALQDFLKSPKLRGNIGEQILEQMLQQALPKELYAIQHQFSTGAIVDAMIHSEDGIIAIDAKFPMENYQKMVRAELEIDQKMHHREFIKDIKKHITDISKKYILPAEGTVNFALMYIPSESVYYEVISDDSDLALHAFATEKRVLFVSPNSFYYFLRVLLMGMQGKRVAEKTREIMNVIQGIQKDAEKFSDSLRIVSKHVGNAHSAVEKSLLEYQVLQSKIARIDEFEEISTDS